MVLKKQKKEKGKKGKIPQNASLDLKENYLVCRKK